MLTELLRRRPRRDDRRGVVIGLVVLAALVAGDILLSELSATLAAGMLLAPLVTGLFAGARPTALVAFLAVVAAAAASGWHASGFDLAQVVRVAIVAVGGGFAVLAAAARTRADVRERRLALLDGVGAVADGTTDLDTTLARIAELVVPALADACLIDSTGPGDPRRLRVEVAGDPDGGVARRLLGAGASTWPWTAGAEGEGERPEGVLIADLGAELRDGSRHGSGLGALADEGFASVIAVPFGARGRILGTLTLAGRGGPGAPFREERLRFASTLAGRVGLVLDNAGLSSELSSAEAQLRSVVSMLGQAVLVADAGGRVNYANEAAARLFGFAHGDELLALEREQLVERVEVRGLDGRARDPGRAFEPGYDADEVLRITAADGTEIWGAVHTQRIAPTEHGSQRLLTTIEDQTGIRRAEFAQSLIARTGRLLTHSTDYRKMLDDVARLVVGEFCDRCSINLLGGSGVIEQVAVSHVDPARTAVAIQLRERYPIQAGDAEGIARVLAEGRSELRPRAAEWVEARCVDPIQRELMREVGHGSLIEVPMRAGERTVGVLEFANMETSRPFEQADLEVAEEIGRRAGEAVENARLATERARVADILQRELLPPELPAIPGWELAAMYHPAGEVNQVGGDFYDLFEAGGRWFVVLGDVVGRGATAASLTAEARHTIRTAIVLGGDPGEALELLNTGLLRRAGARLCSTVILGLGSEADARLTIWSAGHPLPVLVRNESALEVGDPGPLLGVSESPDWPALEVELETGDQIAIYTDGVIEARGARERFGVERMRATLVMAERPAAAISGIEAALDRFLPEELDDDAAMIVLRRASVTTGGGPRERGRVTRHT